jgi:hypothetical protein
LHADETVSEVLAASRSKRKHKQLANMDAATQQAIKQRIADSMARKAAKPRINCPACGVLTTRVGAILQHMDKCCPDLLTPESREQVGCGLWAAAVWERGAGTLGPGATAVC